MQTAFPNDLSFYGAMIILASSAFSIGSFIMTVAGLTSGF